MTSPAEIEAAARSLAGADRTDGGEPIPWNLWTDDARNAWRDAARAALTAAAQVQPEVVSDHDFLPVIGHPDDDECTHRADGTDLTYCGEPEDAHQVPAQPAPEAGWRDLDHVADTYCIPGVHGDELGRALESIGWRPAGVAPDALREEVARAIAAWSDERGQGPHYLCDLDGSPTEHVRTSLTDAVLAVVAKHQDAEVERLRARIEAMAQDWEHNAPHRIVGEVVSAELSSILNG